MVIRINQTHGACLRNATSCFSQLCRAASRFDLGRRRRADADQHGHGSNSYPRGARLTAPDACTGVVTLLTGARSAVGRLISKVLMERGVRVIRLVRSEAGAATLASTLPGSQFSRPKLKAGRTVSGPPPRAPKSMSQSTVSAAVSWATSRTYWLSGRGPLSTSVRLAARPPHSPVSTPFPDAQGRGARQLDAAAGGAAQSRHRACTEARAGARNSVRGCRTVYSRHLKGSRNGPAVCIDSLLERRGFELAVLFVVSGA
jgi:hypothetical protein